MQIHRLDIGLCKYTKSSWKNWLRFEHDIGCCGCHIWTVGLLYVTWLGDECLNASAESEQDD